MIDIKTESKILMQLSKMFKGVLESDQLNEEEFKSFGNIGVMSEDNVYMVVGKTKEANLILRKFYAKNTNRKLDFINSLNWESKSDYDSHKCKLNLEIVINALNFFKCQGEEFINQSLKSDYPTKFENNNFIFILAPAI